MSKIARQLSSRKRRIKRRVKKTNDNKYRRWPGRSRVGPLCCCQSNLAGANSIRPHAADHGVQNVPQHAGKMFLPDREDLAPSDLPRARLEPALAVLLPVARRSALLTKSPGEWANDSPQEHRPRPAAAPRSITDLPTSNTQ